MATVSAKAEDVKRSWFVVDANGKTLGRLASRIASVLKGKTKPIYTTHVDTGDFVIVVNAEKIAFTGTKLAQKMYRHHTRFPGGLRSIEAGKLKAAHPERVIEAAVRGMLPKTKLGRKMFKKLKVYAGPAHPHTAQSPAAVAV